MKPRPKTGEPRQVKQPLKIDRLPTEVHDEIRKLRKEGKTWSEIEELSKTFVKWETIPTEVLELFPNLRLPHSNLQRWNDLRVEQVQREVLADTERAKAFADVFAGRDLDKLDEQILGAFRDTAFSVLNAGAGDVDKDRFLSALNDFSLALTRITRVRVAQKRLDLEQDKIELARQQLELMKRKVGSLKEDVEKKKLTPLELQQRLDDLYGITAN